MFAKAIEDAQKRPDNNADNERDIQDILRAKTSELYSAQGLIPGMPDLAFEYHCARLRIGEEQTGMDERGNAITSPIDESDRLKEIMDMQITGKAVPLKRQETFLKDGTIVIWLEWMTFAPKKEGEGMSLDELLNPSDDSDGDSGASEDP